MKITALILLTLLPLASLHAAKPLPETPDKVGEPVSYTHLTLPTTPYV